MRRQSDALALTVRTFHDVTTRKAAAGDIDAVVHMGDHCYNLGFTNDRRGDAYMNAWQGALTTVPWFPIIGTVLVFDLALCTGFSNEP
jgi:hypothetical protein